MTPSLALAAGWSIIPTGLNKKPILTTWKPFQNRRPTEQEVSEWQRRLNPATWALVTGAISGRITLDFDGERGRQTLRDLGLEGIEPHRSTPSGGFHIDFVHPGWRVKTLNAKTDSTLKERWPGLDIRADGGYCCFTGRTVRGEYRWLREPEPYPLDLLPVDLREHLGLLRASDPVPPTPQTDGKVLIMPPTGRVDAERLIRLALDIASSGGRNNGGFWLAQQLRDNGYRIGEAELALRGYRSRCPGTNTKGEREPYTEQEVQASLHEAYSRAAREPWGRRHPKRSDSRPTDASQVAPTTKEQTNVAEVAEEILKDAHIAKDAGGRLYVLDAGVYKPNGEPFIRQRVKSLYQRWGLEPKWSKHKSDEVIEYIRVDAPELWTDLPANTVNVLNGLLDVRTRKLRPHSPEFLSPVQLPLMFDPSARCPAWDKFIAEVFPSDSEAIAWEIPAWLMTAENSIQKAVLLLGEGSNGKSTYLRACVAFIGKSNTAALSLHKLEQDKFAAARLVGKLANICPDLPSVHLASTMMFKALTGGDVLSAEYKFKDSFEYVPFCKLIFSANKPPQSDDASHGFFRRWQVVPFERCFEEGSQQTAKRNEIDATLSDPGELSGVLNKALEALTNLRKGGFTQSESMRLAWDEFRTATDPLSVWLDQSTVELPNAQIPITELSSAFNRHMSECGKQSMTKTAFGLAIKRLRKNVEVQQRTHKGVPKVRVYVGLTLKQGDQSD